MLVGGDGNSDGNGSSNLGCGGKYIDGNGWEVVSDEPRLSLKLDRPIDELYWSFMFYLICELIYLGGKGSLSSVNRGSAG